MIRIIVGFILGILVCLFCPHSTDLAVFSRKCERAFQTHLFHQEPFYNASYNISEILDSFLVTVEPINKDTTISITKVEDSSTNISDTSMTNVDYSASSTIHDGNTNLLLSLLSIDFNFMLFPLLLAIQYINYKYIHNYLMKLRSIEKITRADVSDDEINSNTQSSMNEHEVNGSNDNIYKEFLTITEAWKSEASSTPPSLLLSTGQSSSESPSESSSEPSTPPAASQAIPPVIFSELESTSSLAEKFLQSPINKLSKVRTHVKAILTW